MSRARGRSPGAYARSVEDALARLLGKPSLLSPRDWALVSEWHERGVPLGMVLEVMEETKSGSRRGRVLRTPRSLTYFAPAVEEAWQVLRAGRSAPVSVDAPHSTASVATWESVRAALPEGSALADLLARLLDRLRRGMDAATADRELDEALLDAAPREMVEKVEAEADRSLFPFRARMDPSVLDRTRTIAVRDRLRKALGLPRISLSSAKDSTR